MWLSVTMICPTTINLSFSLCVFLLFSLTVHRLTKIQNVKKVFYRFLSKSAIWPIAVALSVSVCVCVFVCVCYFHEHRRVPQRTKELSPLLTDFFNESTVRIQWVSIGVKRAIITALLKKPTLSADDPASFTPVSNLPFISKILEKVFALQLGANYLFPRHQSNGHKDEVTLWDYIASSPVGSYKHGGLWKLVRLSTQFIMISLFRDWMGCMEFEVSHISGFQLTYHTDHKLSK